MRSEDARRWVLQSSSPGQWQMPDAWRPFDRTTDQGGQSQPAPTRPSSDAGKVGEASIGGENRRPVSDAGRTRRAEAARRTMRMRHRRREALEWVEWMMRHHADGTIRVWGEARMQVILRPYENALKSGGIEELCELAEVAGIDVRSFANGPECLGAIFSRYMPSLDVLAAAADLRKGATEPRNFASP